MRSPRCCAAIRLAVWWRPKRSRPRRCSCARARRRRSPAPRLPSPAGRCEVDEARPVALDAETKAIERPADHEAELRLWLRLLTCTKLIESEVRRRLRNEFDVTLPRFDMMAQLDK